MAPHSRASTDGGRRNVVIDVVRGLTVLWMVLFHFYVDTRGIPGADATAGRLFRALGEGDALGAASAAARAIAGAPGCRLDVFLFLSGLTLTLGVHLPASALYRRRAAAVLPDYWLGSLAAFLVLVGLAAVRSLVLDASFLVELHEGQRLAHERYPFEWLDLLRSAAVVGRLESPRTMQVVAPSLWYLVLVGQLYLVFPLLRAALLRWGPVLFLAGAAGVTIGLRAAVSHHPVLPGFDPAQTVTCFLPFRLLAPAAGMVAAKWAARLLPRPRGVLLAILAPVALVGLLVATWIGRGIDSPGSGVGRVGGALPLALTLPALWVLASLAARAGPVAALLAWAGRSSLAVLVAQDLLRLVVGNALALTGELAAVTWPLAPFYVAAALAAGRAWQSLPGAGRRPGGGSRQVVRGPRGSLAATPGTTTARARESSPTSTRSTGSAGSPSRWTATALADSTLAPVPASRW